MYVDIRRCCCGASEGELHEDGCWIEKCAFCGGQRMSCKCKEKWLAQKPALGVVAEGADYTQVQNDAWQTHELLKGRKPHQGWPARCRYCGSSIHESTRGTRDWRRYTPVGHEDDDLCRGCLKYFKLLQEKPDELQEMSRSTCECGAVEGSLHEWGCEFEECKVCHDLLSQCQCRYTMLKIDCSPGSEAYEEGLTAEQEAAWTQMVLDLGRVPHADWPCFCERCGEIWPTWFHVSNKQWRKHLPPGKYNIVLCRHCYDVFDGLCNAAEAKRVIAGSQALA